MPSPVRPEEVLPAPVAQNRFTRWNSAFADWTTKHVLASLAMFNIALVTPWVAVGNERMEWWALIVSNWIQWWALPALQRSQNKIQHTQTAMAEADHRNLSYVMDELDYIERFLKGGNGNGK